MKEQTHVYVYRKAAFTVDKKSTKSILLIVGIFIKNSICRWELQVIISKLCLSLLISESLISHFKFDIPSGNILLNIYNFYFTPIFVKNGSQDNWKYDFQ